MNQDQEPLIYATGGGHTKAEVRMTGDTVWLSQAQLADLFQKDKRTISGHIRNIFEEGELAEDSVVRKYRTSAADGKEHPANFHNLETIIAVGYRVKSRVGTAFRRWATEILSEYARKGFAMNDTLLKAAGRGGY